MPKKYKFGIVCGRFQVFHKGHRSIIDEAINQCEKVAVFICSAQTSGTDINPFDYEFRKKMVASVYNFAFDSDNSFVIYPLDDLNDGYIAGTVGNNEEWGRYLLKKVEETTGMRPDAIFSGAEVERNSWFNDSDIVGVDEVFISRSALPISATQMRKLILESKSDDDLRDVYQNTPAQIWRYIPKMKNILADIHSGRRRNIVSEYDDFRVFRYDDGEQLYYEDFDYEVEDSNRITPIKEVMNIPFAQHQFIEEDELLDMCDDYDVSYEIDYEIPKCGGGDYVFAKYVTEVK